MPNRLPQLACAEYGALIDVSGVIELRQSVFPLVFSKQDGTFLYHGSCFSVSYEGGFCTAMHVINDGFGSRRGPEMREQGEYGLIYLPGVAYGAPVVWPFRRLTGARMFPRDPNPLDFRTDRDPDDIGYDVARARFALEPNEHPYPLWVHAGLFLSLKVGSDVIAVGFNAAAGSASNGEQILHYSDCLSAVRLKVTKLEFREPGPLGGGPIMTLNENIPGGLSGGPIFTADGSVVGLVSTGITGQQHGTAVWLEPYGMPKWRFPDLFPEQAHDAKDWFEAWAVIDQDDNNPRSVHWSKQEAEAVIPAPRRVQRVWRDRGATSWIKAPDRKQETH